MGVADEACRGRGKSSRRELRAKGDRYHIHHPFHVAMNSGGLHEASRCRGWVLNRFYYQVSIPIKDAARHRRTARTATCAASGSQRILDHDGVAGDEGGIEAWLRLGEAVGLSARRSRRSRHVLPGVRFAVDAYVNFARRAPWQEAVCSSLTELFAPQIHKERLASWPEHYPWIDAEGYGVLPQAPVNEARRDVEHGLRFTLDHFRTREQQERALEILQFKLDVLWAMLDAMQLDYGIGEPP